MRVFGDFVRCPSCRHLYLYPRKVGMPNPWYLFRQREGDTSCYCNRYLLVFAGSSRYEGSETPLDTDLEGSCLVCVAPRNQGSYYFGRHRHEVAGILPCQLMERLGATQVPIHDHWYDKEKFYLIETVDVPEGSKLALLDHELLNGQRPGQEEWWCAYRSAEDDLYGWVTCENPVVAGFQLNY